MAKRKERKKAILKNGSKDTDRSSSPIVGRKTGNGSQIRSGLCPKTKSSTCFRCTVPTLSGTATCSNGNGSNGNGSKPVLLSSCFDPNRWVLKGIGLSQIRH